MVKKKGRPRITHPRTELLAVRLTADERDELIRIAVKANRKPSDWARVAILAAMGEIARAEASKSRSE